MRTRLRPWRDPAMVLLAAETVALFWAYYAFNLGGEIRGSIQSPFLQALLGQLAAVVQSVLPVWLRSSVVGFASAVGLARVSGILRAVAASRPWDVSFSSLSGAVVAPVYFAVRRLLRPGLTRPITQVPRAVHWRIRPPRERVVDPLISAQPTVAGSV